MCQWGVSWPLSVFAFAFTCAFAFAHCYVVEVGGVKGGGKTESQGHIKGTLSVMVHLLFDSRDNISWRNNWSSFILIALLAK